MTAFRYFARGALLMLSVAIVATSAQAADDGQQLLDQATEKRLAAQTPQDLGEVIRLTDEAIKKGLDETNKQFANNLLSGTLLQRANLFAGAIFQQARPDPRWPQMRAAAVKDLERALEIEPKIGDAHYLIARLHALPGGDRDLARKEVEKALELANKDKLARARALTLRANLSTDDEKQLADLKEAIELAPGNEEAVRARGLHYLVQGKFEEAVKDFDAAIAIEPEDASTHEAKGVALLMLKNLDEAEAVLNEAIELSPQSALPYLHRGRVRAEKKDFKAAIEDFTKSLELNPDNVGALIYRARAHQLAGDKKQAREDLDTALKSRPGLTAALELRGVLAATSGDIQQATADFEQLLQVAPDNTELLTQLGVLYSAGKRPRAAIEKFTAALEKDKDIFHALRGRADANLSIGEHAKAIEDFEAALKSSADAKVKEDSGLFNNFAWVLATSPEDSLRDGKRAIELATKACELTDYKEAHILSTLAAAYAESGQWDDALKWSKKAVEIGDGSVKEQLKQELASYEAKKPWREKQNEPEKEPPSAATKDEAKQGESVVKPKQDEKQAKDG
jgi:tetratricopeptide (TPR) repeat protein